ncbi:unnamed protein product (macronuclear) [Paramecium tetraurelia]|uniref:Transmembrane protein n=1 Tax=Paramecium tetraurelia TaxID=5888 RepID=A0D8R8_PARTE|nr:uncharacterized protein GSPATT00014381001 [Paramecium tetraurelia]CAK79435.1 unnamed protein product [Paramecium tetraurelia]|eukprot:XP_001446832.1 hypothetical protein (macronuclear) [Paramecium tetraurelia strain d4-2]
MMLHQQLIKVFINNKQIQVFRFDLQLKKQAMQTNWLQIIVMQLLQKLHLKFIKVFQIRIIRHIVLKQDLIQLLCEKFKKKIKICIYLNTTLQAQRIIQLLENNTITLQNMAKMKRFKSNYIGKSQLQKLYEDHKATIFLNPDCQGIEVFYFVLNITNSAILIIEIQILKVAVSYVFFGKIESKLQ